MSYEPTTPLVERRLRYLERQRAWQRDAATRDARHATPMGTGPRNRHGVPTVPPGQRVVPNWPVLDLGDTPEIPSDAWRLEVGGACEHPLSLSWPDFMALPHADDVSDFHCVTTWSRLNNRWRGVRFRTLAELAVPAADARFVSCTGYDRLPGSTISYSTNLPLDRAVEDDVLLVHTWEGTPLPLEHGGPCRMITPKLYAWKGTKWIRRIEFLADDRPGFWEARGYSNTAEPWLDDRYAS